MLTPHYPDVCRRVASGNTGLTRTQVVVLYDPLIEVVVAFHHPFLVVSKGIVRWL